MKEALKRALALKQVAAVAALTVGTSLMVHAAPPAGAEAAITTYGEDVVTVLGWLILAGITIFGAKKLGQKMGWL